MRITKFSLVGISTVTKRNCHDLRLTHSCRLTKTDTRAVLTQIIERENRAHRRAMRQLPGSEA